MAGVLRVLLNVAEKAANIARVCRQEATLFKLLVQEKTGSDKNKKFVQDFKTLADVVIQEMIRHDVGREFPELVGFIRGEESNKFENGLGDSVTVRVCSTQEETAALLSAVLNGNKMAASLLAQAIHQDLQVTDPVGAALQLPLSPDSLGIWIDPIDATSQYVEGRQDVEANNGMYPGGLQCSLVLIGVYLRANGEPIMGVINQPFAHRDPGGKGWSGQYFWGVSYENLNVSSLPRPAPPLVTEEQPLTVVLSSSEKDSVKQVLTPLCGGGPRYASGAGYKFLCVVLGLVDAYVVSEGSTYKWDSCAPHAILRALGGGVADLGQCQSLPENGGVPELKYHQPRAGCQGSDQWANQSGLVAFLDPEKLKLVIRALNL
ncbi:inositol polyphosphate 1-phosphatase [Amia ocellicauda]|uniref:inositol polyphosphate 1-phosphatase n=1 Tax=Amia ocellicauda TaxID=2972642 RepID=UPI00346491D7